MVAKVKETLSKSAALKAENNNEERDDLMTTAKVEKLKKVRIALIVKRHGILTKGVSEVYFICSRLRPRPNRSWSRSGGRLRRCPSPMRRPGIRTRLKRRSPNLERR